MQAICKGSANCKRLIITGSIVEFADLQNIQIIYNIYRYVLYAVY